ncbi:serine/threonine-kinase ATM-like protein [Actinidia rufa]|uniref:Serine/threonine-kinase ATM-like protein n=1 Tax=Actinidia rufa TaxID=165716 RepID=A0A7J0FZ58_9ERIC|nr:serine/threonine-kinase ATM-like protein [Actinidia rufa]
MSGSDVDNVKNVVVPPPPPRPDFFLSQHTPGARITSELLNEKNFAAWSRSVCLFLGGKGKSGWLLGTITKPNATDPKFVQWEIDNCTILGCLFNSMEPQIYHVFMYHDMVPLLWSSLTKILDGRNLLSMSPSASSPRRQMGLKPEFEALRTQIVNTTPMPSIFEAFAMLDGDERRHRLLQLPPPLVTGTIPDQMALAAFGSRFSGGRSFSGRDPCSFCRGVTHGRDRCFKLHPELRETFKWNKEKCIPHSLNPCQGEAPGDPSMFSRPVPLFESSQVASPTLPPILTSDPCHMYSRRPPALDSLPQSSPKSGNISPISSPVLRRYPTRDHHPPDKLGFSNPNSTKHSIAHYLFNLVGQFLGCHALQDRCCGIISSLLQMYRSNPSKETAGVLGEQLQFLVSKLVGCIPLVSNDDLTGTQSSQVVLSLLNQLTVDSDPSLYDYVKELEPFPELDVLDGIQKFHQQLCQDYSPKEHLLKYILIITPPSLSLPVDANLQFVKRSCYLPPRLLLCSLKALHKKLVMGEIFQREGNAEDACGDKYWHCDNQIVQAVWTLIPLCGLDDGNSFMSLVSDFVSKVGIGDPHSVVFSSPWRVT